MQILVLGTPSAGGISPRRTSDWDWESLYSALFAGSRTDSKCFWNTTCSSACDTQAGRSNSHKHFVINTLKVLSVLTALAFCLATSCTVYNCESNCLVWTTNNTENDKTTDKQVPEHELQSSRTEQQKRTNFEVRVALFSVAVVTKRSTRFPVLSSLFFVYSNATREFSTPSSVQRSC